MHVRNCAGWYGSSEPWSFHGLRFLLSFFFIIFKVFSLSTLFCVFQHQVCSPACGKRIMKVGKKCPFPLSAWLGNCTHFPPSHCYLFPPSCKGAWKCATYLKSNCSINTVKKEKLILKDNCGFAFRYLSFYFTFLIEKLDQVSSQLMYKSSIWADFVCNLHVGQLRTGEVK